MRLRYLALAAVAALAAAALALWSLTWRYAGFRAEVFVDIPKGTSTRRVGRLLADAGVVRYNWQLLLARALRPRAGIQAGEYLFRRPASVWEALERLARGDVFYYQVTVPEGSNLFDIAAALERQQILPAAQFLEAARDPVLLRNLDPRAPTLEGYLFPDTYRLSRHTTARRFCQQMTERFREVWRELRPGEADVHATVTVASLVEKEARLEEERPLVASVYVNRLRLGMPLQCDPTTIYAALLEDRYRGAIYRSDLDNQQRYNTYQHAGLPPGPIANPGRAALEAALRPAETDYLYLVARPDDSGGHHFSKDLEAHQRAVRKYRRGHQQTKQARATRAAPEQAPARARR
ncbi:MAG: endolytic transglycosylase MltG [Acidobacteria bacterium]|nr:endolytic transglycosylase MltG [Acidobacteriota bacterium]